MSMIYSPDATFPGFASGDSSIIHKASFVPEGKSTFWGVILQMQKQNAFISNL